MRRAILYALIGAIAGYALGWFWHAEIARDRMPTGTPTTAPAGDDWQDLLSGPWIEQWSNTEDQEDIFEIADGMLHLYGVSKTKLRYAGLKNHVWGDFDLHVEYKLAPGTNSGIFLRWPAENDEHRGFEIQVLDDYGLEPSVNRSGAVYDVLSPMFNMSAPAGQWNSLDIGAHGSHVVVVHNGWKVVDADLSLMTMPIGKFDVPLADYEREGYIAFQDHGGEVWYRNVFIRPVPDASETSTGG